MCTIYNPHNAHILLYNTVGEVEVQYDKIPISKYTSEDKKCVWIERDYLVLYRGVVCVSMDKPLYVAAIRVDTSLVMKMYLV